MSRRLSENASFSEMDNLTGSDGEPFLQDIGGTNAQTDYVTMSNYDRASFYAVLGTWDSSDDLDEFRIQQASDSSGTGVKDLTTDASGGNYDTDAPLDADGDFGIIEVRAEDLDVDESFDFLRGYVAEAGNTGVDNIGAVLTRYEYSYPKKELQGAAVTGSKVYVDPGT